jgi:hypothetical protein
MLRWFFGKRGGVRTIIGFGDAVDRLSILEIKVARLDGGKQDSAREQFCTLRDDLHKSGADPLTIVEYSFLLKVNSELWDVEDEIREVGDRIFSNRTNLGDDSLRFMDLARRVYVLNDQRSSLKVSVDNQLGTKTVEVKSYKGH